MVTSEVVSAGRRRRADRRRGASPPPRRGCEARRPDRGDAGARLPARSVAAAAAGLRSADSRAVPPRGVAGTRDSGDTGNRGRPAPASGASTGRLPYPRGFGGSRTPVARHEVFRVECRLLVSRCRCGLPCCSFPRAFGTAGCEASRRAVLNGAPSSLAPWSVLDSGHSWAVRASRDFSRGLVLDRRGRCSPDPGCGLSFAPVDCSRRRARREV